MTLYSGRNEKWPLPHRWFFVFPTFCIFYMHGLTLLIKFSWNLWIRVEKISRIRRLNPEKFLFEFTRWFLGSRKRDVINLIFKDFFRHISKNKLEEMDPESIPKLNKAIQEKKWIGSAIPTHQNPCAGCWWFFTGGSNKWLWSSMRAGRWLSTDGLFLHRF